MLWRVTASTIMVERLQLGAGALRLLASLVEVGDQMIQSQKK